MKGTSNSIHTIVLIVVSLFVAAIAIVIVGSAAEDADEPTTGTLSALRNPSLGERLYCKIYCPDPVNDCEIPETKKAMCKAIADSPADFNTYGGGTGGETEGSIEYASFEGAFVPGGTVEVMLPESLKSKYDPSEDDQWWMIFVVSSTEDDILGCAMSNTKTGDDADLCDFPAADDIWDEKISIQLPSERNANNIETKLKEQEPYKLLLILFEKDETVEEDSDDLSLFLFKLGQKIFGENEGIYTVIGLKNIAWSCPSPQIIDGRYYPEKNIVFTVPTEGKYSWVDMDNYNTASEKIEIGKRLGGPYDLCDDAHIYSTCTATVTASGENYQFTMPYTEPGEKVAISYPVYAAGIDAPSPMCRSGKEGYVYNCPATACYTDGPETYIVSSLKDTGAFEANIACKYETKDEQCPIHHGCIMLLGNTAECSLPKPDLSNAYMKIIDDEEGDLIEKELKEGVYIKKDDIFLATAEYSAKSVFVAIKNTAKAIENHPDEPKIRVMNLEVTALLDSVSVAVSPLPWRHYKASDGVIDEGPVATSELLPGDILEYEIPLTGKGDALGPHTLNIEVAATGNFESGATAELSADTQTSRSYSYTVYPTACKDCSFTLQPNCEACGGRCVWNSVAPSEAACTIK